MSITKLNNLSISAITALPSGVGGKILQVSNLISTNSNQTIATATYTDLTSMSLSITPSSTSNKILLVSNIQAKLDTAEGFGLAYVRNSTIVAYSGDVESYSAYQNNSQPVYMTLPFVYIDSPSTTSSITYKIQASTLSSVSIDFSDGYGHTFYAMEIKG